MSLNQLMATQACQDVTTPNDIQSRRGLNLLIFPYRALFAIFVERFSVQGIVLSTFAWGLFIGIFCAIYFSQQNWLNSWNRANKDFGPALVSTLLIYTAVGFIVSGIVRTPACVWMVNDVTAKLNPAVGPSIFPAEEALYQNVRDQQLSQGRPVPPAPAIGAQYS